MDLGKLVLEDSPFRFCGGRSGLSPAHGGAVRAQTGVLCLSAQARGLGGVPGVKSAAPESAGKSTGPSSSTTQPPVTLDAEFLSPCLSFLICRQHSRGCPTGALGQSLVQAPADAQ